MEFSEKIIQYIKEHPEIKVIAIDGRAAAGKSTLADLLGTILDAEVIRMDDFFLPPGFRSNERYNEPGGNVHYERFAKEVLPMLGESEGFSYKIFDCSKMDFHGERQVTASPLYIVEGAYSLHPEFGDYADLKIFLDIDSNEQMRRITARNGEEKAEMFRQCWIPMEERYFAEFQIQEKVDYCVRT